MTTEILTPEEQALLDAANLAAGALPAVVAEPVVPPAPVVIPELRYEYQPTDAEGRALGGKQVIKYRTTDELAEKLRDQNIELVRKLREVTRKQRLGIVEDDDVPADADRLPSFEFRKKVLTPEDRYSISQDLNDPSKFDEASGRLFEAQTGATPTEFITAMNEQQLKTNMLLARQNASIFFEQHPEFSVCEPNVSVLCDWMTKKGLQPTVKNFEIAQVKLTEAGLLLSTPPREVIPTPAVVIPVPEVVPPQAPAVPVTRISDEEQNATRQARIPSGLNSRVASNSGLAPETGKLTLAQVDRMSGDEYKKRILSDPSFSTQVNDLYAAAAAKRQQ